MARRRCAPCPAPGQDPTVRANQMPPRANPAPAARSAAAHALVARAAHADLADVLPASCRRRTPPPAPARAQGTGRRLLGAFGAQLVAQNTPHRFATGRAGHEAHVVNILPRRGAAHAHERPARGALDHERVHRLDRGAGIGRLLAEIVEQAAALALSAGADWCLPRRRTRSARGRGCARTSCAGSSATRRTRPAQRPPPSRENCAASCLKPLAKTARALPYRAGLEKVQAGSGPRPRTCLTFEGKWRDTWRPKHSKTS